VPKVPVVCVIRVFRKPTACRRKESKQRYSETRLDQQKYSLMLSNRKRKAKKKLSKEGKEQSGENMDERMTALETPENPMGSRWVVIRIPHPLSGHPRRYRNHHQPRSNHHHAKSHLVIMASEREDAITDAINAIRDGQVRSARAAARAYGVPRATLQDRLHGATGHSMASERLQASKRSA
jgi:hypothetical protein